MPRPPVRVHVLGRDGTDAASVPDNDVSTDAVAGDGSAPASGDGTDRPPHAARIGAFLARDGSVGAPVGIDLDRPHAGLVFGKRGTGKSYTLGVLAEELADAPGVAPVVVDPMGAFGGLAAAGGRVVDPAVRPAAVPPSAWPDLLGLDPAGGPGSLVWRVVADAVGDGAEAGGSTAGDAAAESPTVAALREAVAAADAPAETRRAASNHLRLAASWGVFDAEAPPVASLAADGDPTVLARAGVPDAAAAAVVRAVARGLYDARIAGDCARLPWLLVDEAHAFFDGVAEPALRTLLTRGRAPGVSLVCATQRPAAVPTVAVSQSDLLVSHRLTAARDVDRLAAAEATYLGGDLAARLPDGVGEALIVDDATETAHTVRIRERRTPHDGASPRASRALDAE
jgi:hypothetical protein